MTYLQRVKGYDLAKEALAIPRDVHGAAGTMNILNNRHWYESMSILDFLANIGSKSRILTMLDRHWYAS